MEKNQILILAAIFVFAGFRIYQKYYKKNRDKSYNKKNVSAFGTSSNDDDYEPYSKTK